MSSECHKRNFNNGVQQSNYFIGNARIESITREHIWHQYGAEDTVSECHNQKNCQEVTQLKEHQESVTIRSIFRKCHNYKLYQGVPQSWVLPGSTTKRHPGSATIESTSRECRNQKVLPGSVTT